MDTKQQTIVIVLVGIAALWLMSKRWFWIASFGIAGLSAGFAALASIIHFQILAAVGLAVLSYILLVITGLIAAGFER